MIRRQIELLKLLSKQREYKPASFFSKSLDVSTKTIYTDITYLQSEVEKYKVDLVRAPRIGIRLEGEKENIQHMLRDLQKDNLSEDEKYTPEYRRLWILKTTVPKPNSLEKPMQTESPMSNIPMRLPPALLWCGKV